MTENKTQHKTVMRTTVRWTVNVLSFVVGLPIVSLFAAAPYVWLIGVIYFGLHDDLFTIAFWCFGFIVIAGINHTVKEIDALLESTKVGLSDVTAELVSAKIMLADILISLDAAFSHLSQD